MINGNTTARADTRVKLMIQLEITEQRDIESRGMRKRYEKSTLVVQCENNTKVSNKGMQLR